jgi:hypothetical protein
MCLWDAAMFVVWTTLPLTGAAASERTQMTAAPVLQQQRAKLAPAEHVLSWPWLSTGQCGSPGHYAQGGADCCSWCDAPAYWLVT